MEQVPQSEKVGIRKRVAGVVNRLTQKALLSYLALILVVGGVTFLVLHYYTDLFKDEKENKVILHQALAAGGVALAAAVAAFFGRLL